MVLNILCSVPALFSAHVLLNVETEIKCEFEHFIIYLQ